MRVLKALAEKGGTEIYATGFLAAASTRNAASVKRAIDKLVREGLVFAREKEYRFVNPFFREWVKRHWQA
jgi:DNA-binding MarR family transcriptional regulator